VLFLKLENAAVDFVEAKRIGIPHWAASISGKSVTVDVNDVDVDCTQRNSFLQNARALIHQCENATIHDLVS
jgi:hypothetical protein